MTQQHISHESVRNKRRACPGEGLEFLRDVASEPSSACALWPFYTDRLGYGRVTYGGKQRPAHRVSWEIYHGCEMGAEFDACHEPLVCHDRSCVNPLHIRPGTRAENMAHTVLDGSDSRGEKSVRAKLTAKDVLTIRADTRPHRVIADSYSVSRDTIRSIKLKRRWGWLADPQTGAPA